MNPNTELSRMGNGKFLLIGSVVLMAFIAFVWLGYESWRFLLQPEQIGSWRVHPGAIDLKQRYGEINNWFAGNLVNSPYPPASYVFLWPLIGWPSLDSALWLWFFTSALAIGWLIFLIIRESGAVTIPERFFIGLLPLSMYATGATIGNGQLIVHIFPPLLAGLLLLSRGKSSWRDDLLATVLLLFALVKLNVSVPFFWIVVFVPGRLRPILLVAFGYLVATMMAISFQEADVLTLFRNWGKHGISIATEASVTLSHGNLHSWLAVFGLEKWNLPASLIVLLGLGIWTYCYRTRDIWILIAVAGLIARFWTYHGWYDDLLILPSLIALFRIVKHDRNVTALILLSISTLMMLAPGGQYLLPPPFNGFFMNAQVAVWIALLIFFINRFRNSTLGGVLN